MSEAKRMAIYARVSTTEQDPGLQLRELQAYAQRLGVQFTEYVDHGVSGAKDRRPQLDDLMRDARRRRFDKVVVWKFDRFARSVKHLVTALDEFRSLDINFVSITEAIDTSTPLGRAMFGIVSVIAEFERELMRERVMAGLVTARAKGTHIGRPSKQLDLVAARARLSQGDSLRSIARDLGVDHKTLARGLKRDVGVNPNGSAPRDEPVQAPSEAGSISPFSRGGFTPSS